MENNQRFQGKKQSKQRGNMIKTKFEIEPKQHFVFKEENVTFEITNLSDKKKSIKIEIGGKA